MLKTEEKDNGITRRKGLLGGRQSTSTFKFLKNPNLFFLNIKMYQTMEIVKAARFSAAESKMNNLNTLNCWLYCESQKNVEILQNDYYKDN